jgi:hypothetical protein
MKEYARVQQKNSFEAEQKNMHRLLNNPVCPPAISKCTAV